MDSFGVAPTFLIAVGLITASLGSFFEALGSPEGEQTPRVRRGMLKHAGASKGFGAAAAILGVILGLNSSEDFLGWGWVIGLGWLGFMLLVLFFVLRKEPAPINVCQTCGRP